MKLISLLVLLFSFVADYALEHNRIDELVMGSTFVLLLWTALYPWRRSLHQHGASSRAASRLRQENSQPCR